MDISVRQIGNGYIIRYPDPKKGGCDVVFPPGFPPEIVEAVRGLHGRVPLELHCASMKEVEEKIPEIIRDYFFSKALAKEEGTS